MSSLRKIARVACALNTRSTIHGVGAHQLPSLLVMTDEDRFPNLSSIAGRMPRGSALIFRHYGVQYRDTLAHEIRRQCGARGVRFLVAGDVGLALATHADGVHFPEKLVWRAAAARRERRDWIITAAAHSVPALVTAKRQPVDAAILSPVFLTTSHPDANELGVLRFNAWTARVNIPVYALGGVNAAICSRLLGGQAVGLAGVSFGGD